MMPVIKKEATAAMSPAWRTKRSARLYHSCVDLVVADINKFCSEDRYMRFADKQAVLLISLA
jgi:hypothetical protein